MESGVAVIRTRKGEVILVDAADLPAIERHTWCLNRDGYAMTNTPRVGGKKTGIYMHRLLAGLSKGDGKQVDHINGNRADNRRSNLRICTHQENLLNSRLRADNTSGARGVIRSRNGQAWYARIQMNGAVKSLGAFPSLEDAKEFRDLAATLLHGEFATDGNHAGR